MKPEDIQLITKNPELAKAKALMKIAGAFEDFEVLTVKGKPGEKGDKPTKEELLALIKPLIVIPPPIKGEPGKDYILTEKDKNEIASKIKVPIVEKITETIIEKQPIVTNEIREVAVKPSANELRDMLETLNKKLSIQAIEGLGTVIEDISKEVKRIGGGGGFTSPVYNFIDDETPSGTVDGANAVFTLSRLPYRGSVKVYVNGQRMRVGEDYTLDSSQRTITFTIAPPLTSIILVDYRTT